MNESMRAQHTHARVDFCASCAKVQGGRPHQALQLLQVQAADAVDDAARQLVKHLQTAGAVRRWGACGVCAPVGGGLRQRSREAAFSCGCGEQAGAHPRRTIWSSYCKRPRLCTTRAWASGGKRSADEVAMSDEGACERACAD